MSASTLRDYEGKKVSVICEECEVLKHFDASALIEQHGDANMPGLLADLAKDVGCIRPKDSYYNRCNLVYYFTHKEWIAKSGMVTREQYEIALGKKLCDVQEWEALTARCLCGRRGRLNKKSLERKFGPDARLRELSKKLRCTDCKKYESEIEISMLPR